MYDYRLFKASRLRPNTEKHVIIGLGMHKEIDSSCKMKPSLSTFDVDAAIINAQCTASSKYLNANTRHGIRY